MTISSIIGFGGNQSSQPTNQQSTTETSSTSEQARADEAATSTGTTESKPDAPIAEPETSSAIAVIPPARANAESVVLAQTAEPLSATQEVANARAAAEQYQLQARQTAIVEAISAPVEVAPLTGQAEPTAEAEGDPFAAAPDKTLDRAA